MLLLKLVGISLISLALAHVIRPAMEDTEEPDDWCGTTQTPNGLERYIGQDPRLLRRQNNNQPSIVVKTHFHVVANSTRIEDGMLTDKMLSDQLQVLNSDFNSTGISFKLEGTHRLVDKVWSTSRKECDHLAMKTKLRKGDYKTLNIYFRTFVGVSSNNKTLFGNCYLPDKVTNLTSPEFYGDGCQILYGTVPGGIIKGSNLGRTATHEVGHWLGLFHTFKGGCEAPGDYVDDTPPEATQASGCEVGRNTCTGDEFDDPIHNHMDYSAHACRTEFTPGQAARMHGAWNDFRL